MDMNNNISKLKQLTSSARQQTTNILSGKNNVVVISFIIIFFILFALISWIYNILSLRDKSCTNLSKLYPENNTYKTSTFFSNNSQSDLLTVKHEDFDNASLSNLLKNYYIKTAYNCCCGDGYKNNFVDKCALEKCIAQGARCLDFEIYSYNGQPIVAASTANNNSIKETYNYLKLDEVFDILHTQSFDNEYTQCHNDPMFLHFRIMSENKPIYDIMAKYIENNLKRNMSYLHPYVLSSPGYNDTTISENFLMKPINNFKQKFIIMVNSKTPNLIDSSDLRNYVNLKSGTSKTTLLRFADVAGPNNTLLIEESKTRLIIILPDISNRLDNYDPFTPSSNGCQFIGMKFQNMDPNLLAYNKFFKEKGGFSFILKPISKRSDRGTNPDAAAGVILNTQPVSSGTSAAASLRASVSAE